MHSSSSSSPSSSTQKFANFAFAGGFDAPDNQFYFGTLFW
jgi:hypothetical protein